MKRNRIGLYCGSFSPLHIGHIGIIQEVLNEDLVDKIIVVPTKDYWDKKIAIDFSTRVKCLKTIESEKIIIDSDELDSNAPNTFTLLERLKTKYPDAIFKLIVGADNLPSFNKWVNYQYLLDNYEFIVMNREDLNTKKYLKDLNKKDYQILKCDNFDVSSTFIRENINNPQAIKGLISEEVLKILQDI